MLAIAAGLVVAHVASVIIFRGSRWADIVSDWATVAASIFTAYACFVAIGRSHGLARKFWQLTGTSFVLWALGKCIWLYDSYVLGLTAVPIVPLLIFFLSVAPMFVAIFISEPQTSKSVSWEGLLDAIQILSLILFAYLFLVYVPLLYQGERTVRMMEDELLLWRNMLLAVGLVIRAMFSRSSYIRRLYLPIALITGIYTATTWISNRAQSATDHASPLYDLAWTIPFCMVAVVAILWRQSPDEHVLRPQRLSGVIFAYAPSLALPGMLLLMKPQVVGAQISLALVGLMFSIILFNVRLAMTQRRQRLALEALSVSERKYQSLFERNMAGVYRSTVSGQLLDCNPAFAAMFGYTREELLHLPTSELYFDGVEGRDQFIAELRASHFLGPRECCFRRKDGSAVWVVQNVFIEKRPDDSEILEGTMLDITERRALEAQFRQAQKMEAIGRLAGGVAHDFNNLLTVINGYSAMQLERTAATDPVHHQAKQIRAAADRAADLTRQLLAFSRQQVLEPRRVNLNDSVHSMEKMLRRLIGENIEVRTNLAPNVGTVEVDPTQIDQILMNLVVNARDAMPNGGKLTIQTENVDLDENYAKQRADSTPGRHVLLAVSDSGTGMSQETMARIFEPFFTTKEPGKGTGLGMSMVYGSVKQSGGSIEIYSEVNQGTTVKIYLPRVDAAVEETPPTDDSSSSALGSEKILLVEDNVALRTLAVHVLKAHGYRVQAIERVDELKALLEHEAPCDLLLTDVVMPELKGPELVAQVTRCWPKTKILYMSGYTSDAILHQGVLSGGFHFLQKPFTPDALAAKVREVLDGTGAQSSSAHGSH